MSSQERSAIATRIAELGYDYEAQPKERLAACNLCGAHGRRVSTLAGRDRYGYPASLMVCACCGLGYLSPRLTASGYAHFYESVYRPLVSAYHGRRIDAETVRAEQREYAAELLAFLTPRLSAAPRTILDVGGSTGVVAGVLADRFAARASVLDPAPAELAVARAAGMETIHGLAEDFDPGERRWDLILLCQTIDHLLDLRGTLSALRMTTAAGGHAFVDILDVELMLLRSDSVERVVKIDHPHYLTRSSTAALFALTGYAILDERVTDDGHRGFLLTPDAARQPDWTALRSSARALVTSALAPRSDEHTSAGRRARRVIAVS